MDESKGVESFCLIVDYKDYGRKHMDMKTNMVWYFHFHFTSAVTFIYVISFILFAHVIICRWSRTFYSTTRQNAWACHFL